MPDDVAGKVVRRFHDPGLDIYAYLVQDGDKCIVVFRGSISRVNLVTDFTAVQTHWYFSPNVRQRAYVMNIKAAGYPGYLACVMCRRCCGMRWASRKVPICTPRAQGAACAARDAWRADGGGRSGCPRGRV
jgi:hypothetical protein